MKKSALLLLQVQWLRPLHLVAQQLLHAMAPKMNIQLQSGMHPGHVLGGVIEMAHTSLRNSNAHHRIQQCHTAHISQHQRPQYLAAGGNDRGQDNHSGRFPTGQAASDRE